MQYPIITNSPASMWRTNTCAGVLALWLMTAPAADGGEGGSMQAAQAGRSGRTLAHAAATGGHTRFLKQLLKRGAAAQLWAETTDNQMLAPADFALAHDHMECCEWLQAFLRRGAGWRGRASLALPSSMERRGPG